MIPAEDYNCREQGECYLTYRRRLAREKEQYENDRAIKQTNEQWIEEYNMEAGRQGGNMGSPRWRR